MAVSQTGAADESKTGAAGESENDAGTEEVKTVVCPPAAYWGEAREMLPADVAVGAQNISAFDSDGAFTGEVSARMAKDCGCEFALVGHSERRRLFGESDGDCARKLAAAARAGLRPILCVGESAEERGRGETESVVVRQITAALTVIPAKAGIQSDAGGILDSRFRGNDKEGELWRGLVVAYEPVWAIGGGGTPSAAEIAAAHSAARGALISQNGALGGKIPVLYGGSVDAGNAAMVFACEGVGGALVGGASLDASRFAAIRRAGKTTQ